MFAAALQQSEELFEAASVISYAAMPLPLFYAVSQAGRAIAAAYDTTSSWQIRAHGLTVGDYVTDIRETTVTPSPRKDGRDAYGAVARALGSDVLQGTVTFASLWASLPDLMDHPRLAGNALPALEIRPEGSNPRGFPVLHPAMGTVHILDAHGENALLQRLARYARTDGCEVLVGPLPTVDRLSQATLHWPTEPTADAARGTKPVPLDARGRDSGGRPLVSAAAVR